MEKGYDIRRTKFYKNNVGKLDGVDFNPIKYTFQGLMYNYGLDIICGALTIKIQRSVGGYFQVTRDRKNSHEFETLHIKRIQDVQSYVSKYILLYSIY